MADENENQNVNEETAPEAAAEEAAPEETPAPEEAAPEETPAPEEAAPEEAPAPAPARAAKADDDEPAAPLGPKQRRKLARSTHEGDARPQRSLEERQAERAAERKRKATHRRAYRARSRERRKAEGSGTPPPAPEPKGTGRANVRQGIVVSDKADKTITVRIDMARRHRTYKKIVRTSTTLHAHDERNEANVGDTVRVIESRPLSATKRWRLVDVLERAR